MTGALGKSEFVQIESGSAFIFAEIKQSNSNISIAEISGIHYHIFACPDTIELDSLAAHGIPG